MRALFVVSAAAAVVSCGVPSENVTVRRSDSGSDASAGSGGTDAGSGAGGAAAGGTSGDAGTSGAGAGGSGAGGVPDSGAGGVSSGGNSGDGGPPSGCDPVCAGDTPVCVDGVCVACLDEDARCNGNTPELCVDGSWVPQTPCGGTTAACSNGVCRSVRLSGGLVTEATPAPASNLRLREHGFVLLPRTCGTSVCVTGGILP